MLLASLSVFHLSSCVFYSFPGQKFCVCFEFILMEDGSLSWPLLPLKATAAGLLLVAVFRVATTSKSNSVSSFGRHYKYLRRHYKYLRMVSVDSFGVPEAFVVPMLWKASALECFRIASLKCFES